MKLGMFGLCFFMGLGVALGYMGHDTLKSASASASHAADTVSNKVADLRK
jgi:hypothetical protein